MGNATHLQSENIEHAFLHLNAYGNSEIS